MGEDHSVGHRHRLGPCTLHCTIICAACSKPKTTPSRSITSTRTSTVSEATIQISWSSKKITITIRMYSGQRYNARVYHQRCRACQALSRPVLDDSYADRVAYRLLKWCGVEQEIPEFAGESKGPHQQELCEGCKAGHCGESSRFDGLLGQFSNMSLTRAQTSRAWK